jgi:hypothetical protein
MKTSNRVRTLSINLSLDILALGFSALGLVSVISKQPSLSTSIFSVEHTYSLVGTVTAAGAETSLLQSLGRCDLPRRRHCLQRIEDWI